MNKKQIILDFIEDLKFSFIHYEKPTVFKMRLGVIDINGDNVYMDCICSIIESENKGEELYFDPVKNKFIYYGETPYGNITGHTFFYLNRGLTNLLPIDLLKALRRVAKTGITETFIFPANELTDNLEDD